MHHQRLAIIGILICLGISQAGCGVLGQLNDVRASATETMTDNDTSISEKIPISRVTNEESTAGKVPISSAAGGSTISKSAQQSLQYPSFGLDVTGAKVLALNERLAELGYLPLTIGADTQPSITLSNLDSPPQVSFRWRYENIPPELSAKWSADRYTEMTRAAVIAVEHVNGLAIDGIVGEEVWKAILGPDAVRNPNPYTYVLVKKNPAPEELRVWQAGKWVYQSIVNTGIAGAPSTDGTFAVYKRFVSQTMRGTNPNGTKYVDPGVPYVNYYNGSEAIHGFQRASYGFPQSVGCVELPINNAKDVWSLLNYGTLVTVEGDYVPHTFLSTEN
jgi:peptidoglycan hydrolase-like protein with peptidoglycan-binding domain